MHTYTIVLCRLPGVWSLLPLLVVAVADCSPSAGAGVSANIHVILIVALMIIISPSTSEWT